MCQHQKFDNKELRRQIICPNKTKSDKPDRFPYFSEGKKQQRKIFRNKQNVELATWYIRLSREWLRTTFETSRNARQEFTSHATITWFPGLVSWFPQQPFFSLTEWQLKYSNPKNWSYAWYGSHNLGVTTLLPGVSGSCRNLQRPSAKYKLKPIVCHKILHLNNL